ncbi:MAG: IS91 family transposase, partial [Acidobacteriia bacterium]|nr:IS91 family transposase [Terriglobia bacterium]
MFPALDFRAALCTHVPDSGQQLVRYYGAFSNARPVSARAPAAGVQPLRQDDSDSGAQFARGRRRSWARLIKKVYEADPLVCPRCSGALKIISLIGDGPVIERILRHLKLWHRPERPPPRPAGRAIQ